jgi:tetratricopeptide (TPR) repeat protein
MVGSDVSDQDTRVDGPRTDLPSSLPSDDRTPVRAPPIGGRAADEPAIAIGSRIGRYVVLRRLGEGGMGVVYEALDPDLGRHVALKLLWPGAHSADRARRMRREAQAMAQLNHSHVVKVFDVGTEGDQVYVAMELVDGDSLAAWLTRKTRGRREVLALLVRAGEGLVAAHEAGLVHRDFKPANVLVSDDERVLVTDFGLARTADDTDGTPPPPKPAEGELDPREMLKTSITNTGAMIGTPAYMAPEQHTGGSIDARADQYAFCVTLWEALVGRRPFVARDADALLELKRVGKVREDDARRLPRRLRGALLRGLDPDPQRRHPSMRALIDALRSQRRTATGAAVGAVIVATAAAAVLAGRGEPDACASERDEVVRAWNDDAHDRVRAAMLGTAVPYAEHAWTSVAARLDAYVVQWMDAHEQLCRDRSAGEEGGAQLACLHRRRSELQALVEVLAEADATVVERAVQSAADLAPVARCSDPGVVAPDEAPDERGLVDGVRARIVKADALARAGRSADAIELAREAGREARAIGRPALATEADVMLGAAQRLAGDARAAEPTLENAFWQAQELGDDASMTRAATELVTVVGFEQARTDDGLAWARHASAAVERAGNRQSDVAELLVAEGNVLRRAARWDDARDRLERAREIRFAEGGRTLAYAAVMNNLASLAVMRGDIDAAGRAYEMALAIDRELLGDEHPRIAITLSGLGVVQLRQARYEDAVATLQRAIALRERTLGPDHLLLASPLNNLGITFTHMGRYDDSLAANRRALEIRERALPPDHPDIAESLNNIGVILQDQQKWAEAEPYFTRAIAIQERTYGPEHPNIISPLGNLGSVMREQGRAREALRHHERALAIAESVHDPDNRTVAIAVVRLAETRLMLGELAAAKALLERALPRLGEADVNAFARGDARLALARVRAAEGARNDEVARLVDGAIADYDRAGTAARPAREIALTWLRERERQPR